MLALCLVTLRASIPASIVALVHLATQRLSAGETNLGLIASALIVLGVLEGVLSYVRTRITKRIAWSIAHSVRADVHRALLEDHLSKDRLTGNELTSLSSQVDEVQYMVSAIVTLLRSPLTLSGLFVVMLYADWRLALFGACALPITGGIAHLGGLWMRKRSTGWRDARQRLLALAEDQLRNLVAVKAYVAETAESQRFATVSGHERDMRIALETDKVLPRAMTRLAALSLLACLLMFGGQALSRGSVAPADLLAVLIALGLAARPLADLAEGWALYQRSDTAYQHLCATLARRGSSPSAASTTTTQEREHLALTVEMEGVEVLFENAQSPFEPFDLRAEAGECVAITAPSGTGKTTLFRLLGKHHRTYHGRVHVGERALGDWSDAEIRLRVGVVHQEPLLFARSMAENLSLHHAHTEDSMREALELAGAASLLQAPEGIHRALGEGGAPLSGGEMQRLCLARAILHAQGLMLLDEPTSQLDDQTVHAFGHAIRQLKRRHTILIASHDARLLALADRVVALQPKPKPLVGGDA